VAPAWAFTCALTKVSAQANTGPAAGGISFGPSFALGLGLQRLRRECIAGRKLAGFEAVHKPSLALR
jgi:hypothetical protein